MTRRTHSTVEQAPGIGDAIGRYRIIGVLGDGSLGRLYVAQQHGIRGISKTVALRCIRDELARSPQFRTRFSEAASSAARCDHPNLVTIFEMGHVDARYFISMEYLPGENLAAILSQCNTRESVSADIAAYVVKQASCGLQYLRDLREASPQRVSAQHDEIDSSNVFVSYHGTVKWLNIGLQSLARAAASIEADPAPSPASAARAPAAPDLDADRHIDVSRLGVLLWTCLVGEKPPSAASGSALNGAAATDSALRHGAGPPSSLAAPRSIRADVPDALDAIVRQALCADPGERFPSPHALSDALDRYLFRREARPTPKHVRRWMEQLFGSERASLQMQIARGRDVEAALSRLAAPPPPGGAPQSVRPLASPRPRELWSTSHSVFSQLSRASIAPPRSFERVTGSAPDERSRVTSIPTRHMPSSFMSAPSSLLSAEPPLQPPKDRPPRTGLLAAMAAACVAIAIGIIVVSSGSSQRSPFDADAHAPPSLTASGRVDVRSTPAGAAVFVDGEPTGLRTPVVLKGLGPGRTIHVRVEKSGFASQERQVPIVAGSLETRVFELLATESRVHFVGAPADARIFVDDVPLAVADGTPVNLPVGTHAVRVETPSALLFSGTVDVLAGEQTIQVGADRAIPGATP